MIWADYVILVILSISALISLMRGFVREAISLLGWVVAVWAGITFMGMAANMLAAYISVPSVRQIAGFFVIFGGLLLLTGLTNFVAGRLVDSTGLSGTDRVLGMVFGVGRGVVIVALLILAAGLTPLPQDPWWRESALIPHFERFAQDVKAVLPPEIADALNYR